MCHTCPHSWSRPGKHTYGQQHSLEQTAGSGSSCDACKRLMQIYTQSANAIRMHVCIGTAGLKSTHTHMAGCGLTGPYSSTVNATTHWKQQAFESQTGTCAASGLQQPQLPTPHPRCVWQGWHCSGWRIPWDSVVSSASKRWKLCKCRPAVPPPSLNPQPTWPPQACSCTPAATHDRGFRALRSTRSTQNHT